ncbi:MAG: hypothetical protein COB26_03100 [Piscirickettsiaceae bacterium]|nr:MAG: hypothetical protein COB26_03100 [Piscirickettsiaceae bacterium]
MTIKQSDQIQLKVIELQQEHEDLHYFIDHLTDSEHPDQLRLRRLKKRKLFVKDQIEHLKSALIPDIDA